MLDRQQILAEVVAAIIETGEEANNNHLSEPTEDTLLYGGNDANLDSMGVVLLVANIEERLSDKFGVNLALANEKAMSQRVSPFQSVSRLTDYIYSLTND